MASEFDDEIHKIALDTYGRLCNGQHLLNPQAALKGAADAVRMHVMRTLADAMKKAMPDLAEAVSNRWKEILERDKQALDDLLAALGPFDGK